MIKTENLIFENRQGDILLSKRHLEMGSDGSAIGKLVEFVVLRDDENEWGQIRLYKSNAFIGDDLITIQLRGVNADKLSLMAVARLRVDELKKILQVAQEVTGTQEDCSEMDSLRSTIEQQAEEIESLKLLLREREEALHASMEG